MQKIWAYLELVLNSAGLRALFLKSSGAKVNKTGPNRNYFSIQLDRGLIITKVRGSYANRTGEPVSTHVDRQISIYWLRFVGFQI